MKCCAILLLLSSFVGIDASKKNEKNKGPRKFVNGDLYGGADDGDKQTLDAPVEDTAGNSENRIVGGNFVSDPGKYPWHVAGNGCGGSLVAADIVLTAAHCAGAYSVGGYVYVGGNQYRTVTSYTEKLKIISKSIHTSYNSNLNRYDVMLVKIQPSTKTPIAINMDRTMAYPPDNEPLRLIGYGAQQSGGSGTQQLKEVNVYHMDINECNNANHYNGELLKASDICASLDAGGADSCQGDSGGPLFRPASGNQAALLVGDVSWAYGCAKARYPGVNGRIGGPMLDWIVPTLCAMSDTDPAYICSTAPAPAPTAPSPPPAPSPTPPSSAPLYWYIDIKYDDYPPETGVWLYDTVLRKNVFSHRIGYAPSSYAGKTYYWKLPNLVAGRRYTLKFKDSDGDGFCCKYGSGYAEVYAFRGAQFAAESSFAGQAIKKSGKFLLSKNYAFNAPSL